MSGERRSTRRPRWIGVKNDECETYTTVSSNRPRLELTEELVLGSDTTRYDRMSPSVIVEGTYHGKEVVGSGVSCRASLRSSSTRVPVPIVEPRSSGLKLRERTLLNSIRTRSVNGRLGVQETDIFLYCYHG